MTDGKAGQGRAGSEPNTCTSSVMWLGVKISRARHDTPVVQTNATICWQCAGKNAYNGLEMLTNDRYFRIYLYRYI